MPNWCSNRMYFSGEPAQIAEIKRLASGAVTPFYRRATNEGIQLFLAGSAGLLQTTEDVQFEPCPGLTAAGRGVVSPENIAFTRWLTHLQNGVLLDEQNCLMLHELWLQSGTEQRRWEGLPDDVRDTITALFTAKRGDWCGFWSNEDVSVWWNRLCDNVLPEKTMPFDLLTVLPTRLDVEVNGFNGGVLNGVPSAYHWYTEQYGVKWPAYITITQNIVDFDSDKASSAARAAWGNSSYKIILKQSAKEFAKYNQLYDILLQYIQELIQQARAMVATGNYDEAVIEHINDNMNDATRQIAAFQSQVQVQQDALLVVDRQMSYMRQQLSARMLSRYQNNYHFGGSTL